MPVRDSAGWFEEETTTRDQRDLSRFWTEEREGAAQPLGQAHARDESNEERLFAQLLLDWIRNAQKKSYLPF